MKLSNSFSGALRTFAYFMASGSHYQLKGVDYIRSYCDASYTVTPPYEDWELELY